MTSAPAAIILGVTSISSSAEQAMILGQGLLDRADEVAAPPMKQ